MLGHADTRSENVSVAPASEGMSQKCGSIGDIIFATRPTASAFVSGNLDTRSGVPLPLRQTEMPSHADIALAKEDLSYLVFST